jgi:preprotein translocase subunit YajC
MQLCVMAAMVFYFLLWRSKAKQQDDWAGRERKLFNAVGGGGRLTRSGLVHGIEDVCLEVAKQEA